MSNERSNRVRDVSMNSSRSGSDMDVDAPKPLNSIKYSKILAVQNPIQEEKKSEISDEHHFQSEDQQSSSEDDNWSHEEEQKEGEHEEVENEDEESSENEGEKKYSDSSPSKRLQNEVSALLLHYYKEGLTVDEVIAKHIYGISCSTIYRHYQNLDNFGTNSRRKGSGRISKLNSSVEELIQKYLKEDEWIDSKIIASKLKNKGHDIHYSTINRYLKKLRYKYVKPLEGMVLEEHHKKARKEWCQRHKDDEWDEVLFIDECTIKGGKKSHRQWKKIGENKVNRKKNSGKKINIWGGISMQGKTPLKIYTHNMNSEYFIKTIRELKKDIIKITGNPVVLVADN